MVDYSIDDSFDLHFNDRDNFEEVDGKEEFEQDLVIRIHDEFREIIEGYNSSENITEKVQLFVKRIASEHEVIDSIEQLVITRPVETPGTVNVEIGYSTGRTFEETI